MLATYRRLLSSTREVMTRRLPLHVTKARLTNSHDKATIAVMVAKLDKLEKIYSPHNVNGSAEEPVRSLSDAEQVEVLGPGQECQVKARSYLPPTPLLTGIPYPGLTSRIE